MRRKFRLGRFAWLWSTRRTTRRKWSAIESIGATVGCTAETLRRWVRREERDAGRRAGPTSDRLARLKALERQNRESRQSNEILRKPSAYPAQPELDPRPQP